MGTKEGLGGAFEGKDLRQVPQVTYCTFLFLSPACKRPLNCYILEGSGPKISVSYVLLRKSAVKRDYKELQSWKHKENSASPSLDLMDSVSFLHTLSDSPDTPFPILT